MFKWFWHFPRRGAIGLIRAYQFLFSPDHSFWAKAAFPNGYCKYRPTCSNYARAALEKRGFILGSLKTLGRFLRCNPWSKGGEDLP